ncbi:MAG TPA: type I methionyl aminopeptidase [Myxococcales bacterium LLY-WYZ-16_1]|nr:type I methionyl aminopeptidase [Myxococcales bacterium LLY-WYZ-16_1]
MDAHIHIKSPQEIDSMRAACKLAAKTLKLASEMVKPGVTTEEINQFVHDFTIEQGAVPAPLHYGADPARGIPPFPKSVCTSINDVICHGIPSSDEVLCEGDIVNIDVTSILDGFHGDTSRTFIVGAVAPEVQQLVEVTEEAMLRGIRSIKPWGRIRDIGAAIQDYAESFGYGVVKEYVGHGIGRRFHEPPQVSHYRAKGPNPRLIPGMIFTVEPMINLGSPETVLDPVDRWTVRTVDGKLSAQFEHTVLVTHDGPDILTDWALLD